jgi:two-component system alkaline phosphatase synthesis response regulator PhoP
MSKDILIIEDDTEIVELLEIHLRDEGYSLNKSHNGAEGFDKAISETYDLIILDLMLPEMDGISLCQQLRGRDNNTPILMLTAKSEEVDRVLGLEAGADDYITKPFSIRELMARIKAMFRRLEMDVYQTQPPTKALLTFGDLTIDYNKRKVTKQGQPIELTPKEFDLLWLLASQPGYSYNREQILNRVWGYEFEGYEHTVNSHINRLRSKIEPDLSNPTFILTKWGIGYQFTEEK